jgi:glucose/arabinose dehydrogenase
MEIWAENVSGARDLSGVDGLGNRWLSRTDEGIISLIEVDNNGQVSNIGNVLVGLDQPHGLAIDPQDGLVLYYAETDKVSKVRLYTEGQPEKLVDLPAGGGHFTRSLKFGSDNKLYVSIGSSCNVCQEDDPRRAAIYRMDKDGSNFEQVASGLRNAVFMENDPVTGKMWATEMGRDNLGDNLPPDEINVIEEGSDYGWPFCYGKNVADENFQSPAGESANCENKTGAKINLQAHSAPLGLAFVPEEGWPAEYRLDLLVAYHGSWNRSEPTGYKVMRFDLSDSNQREVLGRQALIEGWLTSEGEKLGRPVDLEVTPAGELFITDDQRGVIYRATTLPLEDEN